MEESYWMVERVNEDGPCGMVLGGVCRGIDWTTPGLGLRFCRKEDAEKIGQAVLKKGVKWSATEHIFSDHKVYFIDDQPITPMPESCPLWPCCEDKEKNRLIQNERGFMVCPSCKGSYGPGPKRSHFRNYRTEKS